MILVADSGSSKTDWRLINGADIQQFECKGLNPDFNEEEDVSREVSAIFNKEIGEKVSQLFLYGSGCSSPSRQELVRRGLQMVFPKAEIVVEHDLLGAARAACGKSAGIAGILGTGSNCCLFDGDKISRDFRSGGFVIGD